MRSIFFVFYFLFSLVSYSQNLLNLNGWVAGTIDNDNFQSYNGVTNNSRIWVDGPQGTPIVAWRVQDKRMDGDDVGGFSDKIGVPINPKKMYRLSVWVKPTGPNVGKFHITTIYNQQGATMVDLKGNVVHSVASYESLPEIGKWFLAVGYIHGVDEVGAYNIGGIYDGVTGQKLKSLNDAKFLSTATSISFSSYLATDANNPDMSVIYDFCNPRLEVVDGNEVPIASLLGKVEAKNSNYFTENVGIKTTNTQGYTLAVKGKIRSQEIKVEAENWPDFVFKHDYNLNTLKEVSSYIKQYGHLPEMPSAAIAEKNGIELGEMNKLLLKKIEELTLYIIQQDNKINEIQQKLNPDSSRSKL